MSSAFSRKRKAGAGGLAFIVGAGTLLVATTPAFAAPGDPVALDPALQACVNMDLGKSESDPVTEGELASLTGVLFCEGSSSTGQVASIAGLQYATGLSGVALPNNDIVDLAPLSTLTGLMSVNLSGNVDLTDVSPLASLLNLNTLELRGVSGVSDVSSLAPLVGLTTLSLSNTGVTSLLDLATFTSLVELELDGLDLDSFAGLNSMASLSSLTLGNTTADDWSALSSLPDLEYLYAAGSGLDTSWFTTLTAEMLHIEATPGINLAHVAAVTGLETLIIDNSALFDVAPLSTLTNVVNLFLDGNQIYDLSPLGSLPALKNLSAINQSVVTEAYTNVDEPNVFTDLQGNPVLFDTGPNYNADTDTFFFDTVGVYPFAWDLVSATNGVNVAYSGELEVRAIEDPAGSDVPALVNFTAIPGTPPQTTVVLNANSPAGATDFTFAFSTVGGGDPIVRTFTFPNGLPVTGVLVDGLAANTTYTVVATYTGQGDIESEPATAEVTTDPVDETPDTVTPLTGVTAMSPADGQIRISFDSVDSWGGTGTSDGVENYTVEYRISGQPDAPWNSQIVEGNGSVTSLLLTGLSAGTYDIRVSYQTTGGDESAASTVNGIVVTGTAPRPDGDGGDPGNNGGNNNGTPVNPSPNTPGNATQGDTTPGGTTPVNASNNLNNSASDIGQVGLIVGGGLMVAAAGALMLSARRNKEA